MKTFHSELKWNIWEENSGARKYQQDQRNFRPKSHFTEETEFPHMWNIFITVRILIEL